MIFSAIFFLSIFLLFLHPVDSGDFFHHLNTGRYIFEHWHLPRYDVLTFTASGKPWVAYGWGSGLLFFVILKSFGYKGISLLFALFGLFASFLLLQTLTKLKVRQPATHVLTLCAASIASLRWPTRPEVLASIFSISLIFCLIKQKQYLKFVPLIFLLWGICYGASALAGILIFLFWILATKSFTKRTSIIFVLSIVASLVNGYGFANFFYILHVPDFTLRTGEWQPLLASLDKNRPSLVLSYQFIILTYLLFVAIYLVATALILLKNHKFIKNNLFFIGLSLLIFYPFYMNKFINLSAFLAMPALGIIYLNSATKIKNYMLIALIFVSLLAIGTRFNQSNFTMGLKQQPFQRKVIDFMNANNLKGNIFSSQEIGAFISWYLPNSKVFIDTRDELFVNTQVFSDLEALSKGQIGILGMVDKYKANIIVGRLSSGGLYEPVFYNNSWKIAFLTDGYFVALNKKDFPNIQKEITSLDPFRKPPAKPDQLDKAEEELTILVKQDNQILTTKLMLIEIKLAKGKSQEARKILNSVKIKDDLEVLDLATRVYLTQRDCNNALKSIDKLVKLSRGRLIFFPAVKLTTYADQYLKEYYLQCARIN